MGKRSKGKGTPKKETKENGAKAGDAGSKAESPTGRRSKATSVEPMSSRQRLRAAGRAVKEEVEILIHRPWLVFSVLAVLTLGVLIATDMEIRDERHSILRNLNFSDLLLNTTAITNQLTSFLADNSASRERWPGNVLKGRLRAHTPVVMIPGVISSGLELWEGHPCAEPYFRRRFWIDPVLMAQFLLDPQCWIDHMSLNQTTGLDPEGIKLRVVKGLSAADYVVPGYWVWARVIENLGLIGYTNNEMFFASYDWRLGLEQLETRDHYFTRLRLQIEEAVLTNDDRPVMLISHSMGGIVGYYFLTWVEAREGGNAGHGWVERHIKSYANIGGPLLGTPKAVSSVLSGEVRDTAQMNAFEALLLDRIWTPAARLAMLRSWKSGAAMLPKGGNAVWGDRDSAPDDEPAHFFESYGSMILLTTANESLAHDIVDDLEAEEATAGMCRDEAADEDACTGLTELEAAAEALARGRGADDTTDDPPLSAQLRNVTRDVGASWTVEELMDYFRDAIPEYMAGVDATYSFGAAERIEEHHRRDRRYFGNPLESALPNAPSMTIYCLYGVNNPTERGYYYRFTGDPDAPLLIDTSVSTVRGDKPRGLGLEYGIQNGNGDGTVPVTSLGYMCQDGWKHPRYNPYGVKVVNREYLHLPSTFEDGEIHLRGGPRAAEHVDILGNRELISDLLKLSSQLPDDVIRREVGNRAYSEIEAISARISERLGLTKSADGK